MQLPFQMPSWEDLVIERICADEYSSRSTAAIFARPKTTALPSLVHGDGRERSQKCAAGAGLRRLRRDKPSSCELPSKKAAVCPPPNPFLTMYLSKEVGKVQRKEPYHRRRHQVYACPTPFSTSRYFRWPASQISVITLL